MVLHVGRAPDLFLCSGNTVSRTVGWAMQPLGTPARPLAGLDWGLYSIVDGASNLLSYPGRTTEQVPQLVWPQTQHYISQKPPVLHVHAFWFAVSQCFVGLFTKIIQILSSNCRGFLVLHPLSWS